MEHISIRRAVLDDAQGILECLRKAFEPYRNSYTPAAFEDTVLSPETIHGRLTKMSVFVAVTETGNIVGTSGASAGSGEGHIRGMAVHPAVVGTGVATSLLEAVENDLRERGCTTVTLDTTLPLERAIRFYARNGFRPTGVVRDFYGMPLFEYLKDLPAAQVRDTRETSDSAAAFTVRTAGVTDISALAHHRTAMFRDMGTLARRLEHSLERATASYLRDALPRGDYLAWVAENDATPPATIGGVGVQLRAILPRPRPGSDELELGPEAIVLNVYVEPGWRRRGVAEALMRTALEALAARGIRRVVLHASDEGRRLYERLGFIATNEMRLGSG